MDAASGPALERRLMRRAKIVATLGPASGEPEVLEKLLGLGVDVARLNFSHGRHEDHARMLDRIRAASRHLNKAVAVLQDLQGPKIRTGPLKAGKAGVRINTGDEIVITTAGEVIGDATLVSTTYPYLAEDVRPGDRLLVDDGLLEFRVLDSDGVKVKAEVVEGGMLGEHKGINLPGVALRAEALSDKDRADVAFGITHGVDFVGLSFVRTAEDIRLCRREMERAGRVVPIIAKIEKPEAIDNLDAIIEAADGLMVARGDLGVEILPERVPNLQKEICEKGNAAGKPVIIATQMLNSMIEHPRPTRAEASDVANAIWDGADAVMLSGETASGRYPLLAVQMMDRIVREAERGKRQPAGLHLTPTPGAAPEPFNLVTAAGGFGRRLRGRDLLLHAARRHRPAARALPAARADHRVLAGPVDPAPARALLGGGPPGDGPGQERRPHGRERLGPAPRGGDREAGGPDRARARLAPRDPRGDQLDPPARDHAPRRARSGAPLPGADLTTDP
jgi:pyruvate kinase